MSDKIKVRKDVTNALGKGLALHGFKPNGGVLVAQIETDFVGLLDLNFIMFKSGGVVGLNPIIGIICQPIEAALAEFTEGAEHRPSPSLTTSLGYLMPEKRFLEWLFDPDRSVEELSSETKHLIACIVEWGLPFIQENCSMPAVVQCLETNQYSFIQRAEYHLPIAYRLLGDINQTRAYVAKRLVGMTTRTDAAADIYRKFAENVCK